MISLPASDTAGSPHTRADDVEVGGQRGREALDRLRNVVGRIESSWRPASAEEGFEIVRRRLFEPFSDPAQFKDRDVVARAFAELYRTQHQEFPPECRDVDYEKRIKAAYPIHPEIFDRLYTDWSTLVKFQRTRGVLRLMAAVIHSLWEKGDRNPLILPANIAIDDPRVQFELTRYLTDNWVPVLEKDVDGPSSLPLRLDGEVPNLGKFAASRRVARAIYLGSAPTADAAHRGIEDRRIKLGCVMPGESPAVFGDALRRLAGAATYLYQDGPRYWYSTQPTVTKLAEDRAEQLKRDPDKVVQELASRLRSDLRNSGEFNRVHPLPQSGQDVPDDRDARLVVLAIDTPYSKERGNAAETAAKAILESRGSAPRLYRNSLVFLAVDKTRLQDLDEAVRRYLAWESILGEREPLDLSPYQVKQAEIQKEAASSAVTARLPEAYQWLLVPGQARPDSPIEWLAMRLSGQDSLAARASKKLKGDELLVTGFAASRLRMELDRVPLWRGDHVSIKQICRGLRALSLSATRQRPDGSPEIDLRRRRPAHLGARCVCRRGQLRRRGDAISWAAWWTARVVAGCRCARVARQAGCRATTARCRETATGRRRRDRPPRNQGRGPRSRRRTRTRNASTRHTNGDSACAVPWDGPPRLGPRGKGRGPHSGRGHLASLRPGWSQGHGDPGDSGGGTVRRPGPRRTHRHGKQPDAEVHESGLREGIERT